MRSFIGQVVYVPFWLRNIEGFYIIGYHVTCVGLLKVISTHILKNQVCQLGFRCLHNDQRNPLFVLLEFRVVAPAQPGDAESMKGRQNHLTEAEQNALVIAPKPCIYKRR